MKYFKISNYILINSLLLCLAISTIFTCIMFKTYNIQISGEIKYMLKKVQEQDNIIKIYQAEIALLTSPKTLRSLYMTYYSLNQFSQHTPLARVKQIDKFMPELAPQYLSLK